jgi:hypothetical protein
MAYIVAAEWIGSLLWSYGPTILTGALGSVIGNYFSSDK